MAPSPSNGRVTRSQAAAAQPGSGGGAPGSSGRAAGASDDEAYVAAMRGLQVGPAMQPEKQGLQCMLAPSPVPICCRWLRLHAFTTSPRNLCGTQLGFVEGLALAARASMTAKGETLEKTFTTLPLCAAPSWSFVEGLARGSGYAAAAGREGAQPRPRLVCLNETPESLCGAQLGLVGLAHSSKGFHDSHGRDTIRQCQNSTPEALCGARSKGVSGQPEDEALRGCVQITQTPRTP